jgi:hypothetical protein
LATALYWSDTGPRRAELAREALSMARRIRDDVTLAFAFSSAQLATAGPDTTEQSSQWLKRLFVLSDRAGESVITLAARSRHVDVLLELDDLAAADVAIETLERLANESRDRRAAACVALHRARRASLEGRFEDAHALTVEIEAMSDELPESTIPIILNTLRVMLTWLQQGPAAIGDLVRPYADGVPAMPCWRAAVAASLAASGRAEEAQLEYDRLAADGFAALPRDNLWLASMALLTETVVSLRSRSGAAAIYAELAPFAGRNIVLPGSAFLGPVEMWLGILARVQGRSAKALEHLAAARISSTRNGARASLMRIAVEEATLLLDDGGAAARQRAAEMLDQAAASCEDMGLGVMLERIAPLQARLVAAAPAPAVAPAADTALVTTLRRIGDVWMIDDGSGPLHISDGRGVRLLALLLARPGREIHSLELVAAVDRMSVAPSGAARSGGSEAASGFSMQYGAGPALDTTAKHAYRARIAELGDEIADAARLGDEERAGRARSERDFVTRELERALGMGGRDRQSGSHAERARVNVTRAIRSAIKRISGYDPELGAELEIAVRTGTFCVYNPDARSPRRWHIEAGGEF